MKTTAALVIVLLTASLAPAELKPEQVAILVSRSSGTGRDLATYYAKARGIPESNICLLRVTPDVDLGRSVWLERVAPEIRAWLAEKGETKIRCLVTCWDMPLRINLRVKDDPVVIARKAYLDKARRQRIGQFSQVIQALNGLALDKPAVTPPLEAQATIARLGNDSQVAVKEARQRIGELTSESKRKEADIAFEHSYLAIAGMGGLLAGADLSKVPVATRARLELAAANLRGLEQGIQAMAALPDTVARDDQILRLMQETHGLMGTIRWIDEQRQMLEKNESAASFDSELSLILWPDYSPLGWQPNLLHYAYDSVRSKRPTMMVARLSAPTPELVRKLIDTSIAVEKTGLSGKVYLDARGIAFNPQDKTSEYGQYDQSLRDLADRLKKYTKLSVVLDNREALFGPGECPDAALYCGWYSLAKYIDAFKWQPGAVAYHIASSEAADLRRPNSALWCPAMLDRGVAATLGPTFEPYVTAFPLPDDFFSLLLTGRTTLVETYYRTCPFTSWAMVLIGDPLYNPFKNHPQLDDAGLPERLKGKAN
jgi:uncharacterized protein (TIGR03790 family)